MKYAPARCSHISDRGFSLYAGRLERFLYSRTAFLIGFTGMRLVDLLPINEDGRHVVVILGKWSCLFRLTGLFDNGIKLRNEHTPKIILHEEFISSRREDFIDDVFHSMPNRR